jgi:hypothetical protein
LPRYPGLNPRPVLSPSVVQIPFPSHFHSLPMRIQVCPEKQTYGVESDKQEAATRPHWKHGTLSSEACVGRHYVCYVHRGDHDLEASCENVPRDSEHALS